MTGPGLGHATRATELIPGSPDSIRSTVAKLQSRADRIDDVNARLRRLDLHGVWEGQAADSFLNAVTELLPHLDFASEADRAASNALTTYAQALEDAQLNASRAIGVWEYGQRLTADAKRDNTVALWGASTELAFDPGESQRANAQRILQLARDEVTDAGNRAASAVRASQSTKPVSLGFWDVVGGTVGNFLGDMGNSAASLMNAMAQHPDEYASVVMGLLSMQGGAAAFAGGLALDATGAGAVAGVAVNVASGTLVVGGATVASAGMSKLLQQAASEDRVQPFNNGSAPPSNSAGYAGSSFDEKLAEQFRAGPPKASDLEKFAQEQGWTLRQAPTGPPKYYDENGIERMTIKRGSARTPGSEEPHVALKDANGKKIDPFGNKVSRDDPGNHTPIEWDLDK